MTTDAEREQSREAGSGSWKGHRRRQLRELGIDVDRLDGDETDG